MGSKHPKSVLRCLACLSEAPLYRRNSISHVYERDGIGTNGEGIFIMDITIPCIFCKHFNRDERENMTCAAYPNGIPKEIQELKVIHTESYPADNGIKYEPLSDEHDYFKYFKGEIRQ